MRKIFEVQKFIIIMLLIWILKPNIDVYDTNLSTII